MFILGIVVMALIASSQAHGSPYGTQKCNSAVSTGNYDGTFVKLEDAESTNPTGVRVDLNKYHSNCPGEVVGAWLQACSDDVYAPSVSFISADTAIIRRVGAVGTLHIYSNVYCSKDYYYGGGVGAPLGAAAPTAGAAPHSNAPALSPL